MAMASDTTSARKRAGNEPLADRAAEGAQEAPPPSPPPPAEPVNRPPPSPPDPAPGGRPAPASSASARPAERLVAQSTVRTSSGPIVSTAPKSPVPIPTLPRVLVDAQPEQIARACQAVESAAISLAGVSPGFAHGVTGPFRRAVAHQSAIYPIAMYYFVVREAALKHDSVTAASNLTAAQANGSLVRFKDLPGIDRGL
jgi:hypothetical protein